MPIGKFATYFIETIGRFTESQRHHFAWHRMNISFKTIENNEALRSLPHVEITSSQHFTYIIDK